MPNNAEVIYHIEQYYKEDETYETYETYWFVEEAKERLKKLQFNYPDRIFRITKVTTIWEIIE